MAIDWADVVIKTAAVLVPVYLYLRQTRSKDRKERDEKHKENQDILSDVQTHIRYFPPHYHTERAGQLTAEGIRKRPWGEDK